MDRDPASTFLRAERAKSKPESTFSGTLGIQGPRCTKDFLFWRMLKGCTLYLQGRAGSIRSVGQYSNQHLQALTWPGSKCCSNTLVFIDGRWVPYHKSSAGTLALLKTVMTSCNCAQPAVIPVGASSRSCWAGKTMRHGKSVQVTAPLEKRKAI